MDWQLAITRNREALERIIAMLFALAGLTDGNALNKLPRHVYQAVLRLLRPAESAVRRLIIIVARGLVLNPYKVRTAPVGLMPNVSTSRQPIFCLIDPLKRFAPFIEYGLDEDNAYNENKDDDTDTVTSIPRISVPGHFDPAFNIALAPSAQDPVNAVHLGRRMQALKRALANLQKNARRLARWQAKRELLLQQSNSGQKHRPIRISACRPGTPPGQRVRTTHEVHAILRECHALMLDAIEAPLNTS